jgi:hypothetical protein
MFTINNFNIIATFPGTKPSSDMSFSAYKNSDVNPSSKKAYQRVISGETDKVSFKASNFGPEAVRNVQCKYVHLSIISRETEISNSILLDILSVFILKRTTH